MCWVYKKRIQVSRVGSEERCNDILGTLQIFSDIMPVMTAL